MTFLIDGYNLLHALGLANRRMPKGRLERARLRMLDWLADTHGATASDVRVVFDAQSAPRKPPADDDHRGVRVRFAAGQVADDHIEELIAGERQPKRLTVVSNDNRVREAARRRGCVAWACQEYVDWLIGRGASRPEPPPAEPAKPDGPSGDEVEEWLRRFGQNG